MCKHSFDLWVYSFLSLDECVVVVVVAEDDDDDHDFGPTCRLTGESNDELVGVEASCVVREFAVVAVVDDN